VTINTILCAIDLSDFSRPVLAHAAALSRWYQAELKVLHVFAAVMPPATLGTYPGWMLQVPEGHDAIGSELRSMLEPFTKVGVALDLRTAEGDAAAEIVRHASELHADLLVMGTHGRGGFDRFALGSVAEKVLRKAPCPVLTLPPGADATTGAGEYRNILCPTDFSASSELGVRFALSFARMTHGTVTILHVIETANDAEVHQLADHGAASASPEAQALHSLVAGCIQPADSVTERVAHGKPYREILRTAIERDADLIVIGVRGRGSVDLTLFGSTTNQVVRRATCPVMTVRSTGEHS
jgi:nucleotide-binding universal stress UspA family protein